MTRGFLLGKFLPPHQGHVLLCDFARNYSDELTILVCSLDREPIPGALRHHWMQEMFPDCHVLHCAEDVPQEPSEHPDFWSIWRDIVRRYHPKPIDHVFASELYGHRLAAEVESSFVPVDPGRNAVRISGTALRERPFLHWDYLPAVVRPYFAKRICIFGPESTGKTTLAVRLADHFKTIQVPEYGRIYTESFGVDCTADDLARIAKGHIALTAAATRQANRIVILDTDPILTAVWSDMLTGSRDPQLDSFSDNADLYLLTGVDVPWIDDGTRYFPDNFRRSDFMARCRSELQRRRLDFVELTGDWDQRYDNAVVAITSRFPDLAVAS